MTFGGVDIQTHVFLTSALVGGEWSALRPGRFTKKEINSSTNFIEICVDPRTDLDDMEKGKILESTGTPTLTPQSSSP
jgi:hypothetical protein